MVQPLFMQQRSLGFEHLDHMLVGLKDMLTGKQLGALQKTAIAADRVIHRQVVACADHIVVQAMAGCGMHRARTRLQCDMLTQDDRHFTRVEGVLQLQPFKQRAVGIADNVVLFDAVTRHHILQHRIGNHQALPALRPIALHHGILQLGVERDRLVGGQCPGGCRPDHKGDGAALMAAAHMPAAGEQRLLIQHRKTDIDGEGVFIPILHFGLGQCRAAIGTPVHRLEALLQMAILNNAPQCADDVGLKMVIHGEVGVLPVTHHPQPLEIGALFVHLFPGIDAAGLAKLGSGDLLPRFACSLLYL